MHFDPCRKMVSEFLSRRDPGVRVIVTHPGSVPRDAARQLFEHCRVGSLPTGARIEPATASLLLLAGRTGGDLELLDSDDGKGRGEVLAGVPERLRAQELPTFLARLGPAPVIFLQQAEVLAFQEIADLLGGIRERRNSGCNARVYVCGPWAPQQFTQTWNRERSYISSPLDGKTSWLEGYSADQILDLLKCALTGVPDNHLAVLADMIAAHTGKDARFVDYLLNEVKDQPPVSGPAGLKEVEHRLGELARHGLLQDYVWDSLANLPRPALRILEAALRSQIVCLDEKDLACETLVIRGLLGIPEGSGGALNWRPSSPVVAAILREQWCARFPGAQAFPPEAELVPVVLPVSAPAQALVTRIENTLRNLLLLTFAVNAEGHPLNLAPVVKKESLFAKASLARDEDEQQYISRLIGRPLSSFLEMGDLVAVFDHGDIYSQYFADIFPNKTVLADWFRSFVNVRNAVAHNKVISIQVLDVLAEQLSFLEKHLGLAAAKRLKEDASAEVVQNAVKLAPGGKGAGGKILGILSASRKLEVDFCGQALDANGQKVVSYTRRVILEAGKAQHVEMLLESGLQPYQDISVQILIVRAHPSRT